MRDGNPFSPEGDRELPKSKWIGSCHGVAGICCGFRWLRRDDYKVFVVTIRRPTRTEFRKYNDLERAEQMRDIRSSKVVFAAPGFEAAAKRFSKGKVRIKGQIAAS